MTSSELWSRATADRYDAEETEMSSAAVLEPTLAFLAELAEGSRTLEFAIGTGRVGVPLRERGVQVAGIELSEQHLGFDTFDLVEQVLVSHHFTRDGDDGRYRQGTSRHRYAWPAELDLMARIAGLELERRVADWDGAPFTEDSTEHISVWRKPH
ncbi:class I SAM-dependent methyltransferase [Streptomyces reniochalinae]|uniref:hypothetical protein n=1 Tax=Streptomyces reniochalinae TaxID=2250578 RepID=UPI0015F053AE|nr:hypothetical protein [Streptomyces reniochalinae]